MRSIIIIFCLLIVGKIVNGQQIYDASLISKDLMPYAGAVIRNEDINIEVKDLDNVIYHIKKAITVLNKNGDRTAHIVIEHDKTNLIKYIKGTVYNEFGKQIGKFSESNFEDVSAGNDFSLFEDVRVKHYLPAITEYPYTIAYEYEERSKQSLNFQKWKPNPRPGVAIEKSTFTFTCKSDFNIRYKETNLPGKINISINSQGFKTYTWLVSNLKAIKYEPYSPYPESYLTMVQIAPEKFTYYGIDGSFTNWKDLGKWEYDKLLANRQDLPIETVEHIKDITKNISDPKEKAKKIYEYMQDKTHYISVQVGIGSNQPFLASDVDKLNYGDCKALVNYTQALLKAVNIESYYCVVESGDDYKVSMLDDFASMEQGNHIILCLPFKNDTTWVDCTNQTIPFGYLGAFTDDRTVLACTSEGGRLIRTPKYSAEQNTESRKANFVINESGELTGEMETLFKGINYDKRDFYIEESSVERIKDIKKVYAINNLEIEKLQYRQVKSLSPFTTENIKLTARDYASLVGGKYFFMLNSVNRSNGPPLQVHNRLNSVYINRGYTEEDEVTYTLPMGYRLEKTPLNLLVNKPFGSFSVNMKANGDKMIYKRNLKIIEGTFSKEIYADMVDFYQLVYDADHYTVSLIKNP